ncbi:unnamed protein product, partial [marine sediment metagenome]
MKVNDVIKNVNVTYICPHCHKEIDNINNLKDKKVFARSTWKFCCHCNKIIRVK